LFAFFPTPPHKGLVRRTQLLFPFRDGAVPRILQRNVMRPLLRQILEQLAIQVEHSHGKFRYVPDESASHVHPSCTVYATVHVDKHSPTIQKIVNVVRRTERPRERY